MYLMTSLKQVYLMSKGCPMSKSRIVSRMTKLLPTEINVVCFSTQNDVSGYQLLAAGSKVSLLQRLLLGML